MSEVCVGDHLDLLLLGFLRRTACLLAATRSTLSRFPALPLGALPLALRLGAIKRPGLPDVAGDDEQQEEVAKPRLKTMVGDDEQVESRG